MTHEVCRPNSAPGPDAARERFRARRCEHWTAVARERQPRWLGGYYHRRLADIYGFLVPPGQSVLELGCGRGDLLAALRPAVGVGVDFCAPLVEDARTRHPDLRFVLADALDVELQGPFDVVVLSDLVNDLWDVQTVLDRVRALSHPRTRLILNFYSRVWQAPLGIAKRLGFATPVLPQNWLTVEDLRNLLTLADFEVIKDWSEILWPVGTPVIADVANRVVVRLWPFRELALTNFIVARPAPRPSPPASVSVIVPARNEAGNIPAIFERTPQLGRGTELIFVEGHSSDDTAAAIQRAIGAHPGVDARLFVQSGVGKGDAVRLGFEQATGDILMILDADLTVPPEDLSRFYAAISSRKGDFINGVRLVYPMEKQAMRFFNLIANKFFSLAFSWTLGQSIKDTLCGTKVVWRSDYQMIAANRHYFGDFDPFGDFDLLFGAAKLGLRIADLPIHYRERVYGETNIQRWTHGWLLLRMLMFAARRIKFR